MVCDKATLLALAVLVSAALVAKIDFGRIDFARIGFGTIAWVDSFGFSMIDLGKIVGFGYFGIISFCIVGIRAPI